MCKLLGIYIKVTILFQCNKLNIKFIIYHKLQFSTKNAGTYDHSAVSQYLTYFPKMKNNTIIN